MLPLNLVQQFSVWTVHCWPRTWLGRWSIGEQTANPESQPPPLTATGAGGILQLEVLFRNSSISSRCYPSCLCVGAVCGSCSNVFLLAGAGGCPIIADVAVLCQPLLSPVCLTLLCPRRGADVPLQVKPNGSCCDPLDVLHVPPWPSPALEQEQWGAVTEAAPLAPQPRSSAWCLQEDSGLWDSGLWAGLAGEGSCGCWEECWLAHLGLHCLPCRARGALAAPGSAGWARMREWRYFIKWKSQLSLFHGLLEKREDKSSQCFCWTPAMPLCLGGNSAELVTAVVSWQSWVQSITQGVIWSARTALVDPFCWGSAVWNSRNSCSVAGEFAWRFFVAGLKLAPSILYFPSVQNPVNARVCPKQSWSWYIETPPWCCSLDSGRTSFPRLWSLFWGVCVRVCACVCSAFVCVCTVHIHLLAGVNCKYVYMYRYLYMY